MYTAKGGTLCALEIWDLPSVDNAAMHDVWLTAMDAVALLVDLTAPESVAAAVVWLETFQTWLPSQSQQQQHQQQHQLQQQHQQQQLLYLLIGTKSDDASATALAAALTPGAAAGSEGCSKLAQLEQFECSAKSMDGINCILRLIVDRCLSTKQALQLPTLLT